MTNLNEAWKAQRKFTSAVLGKIIEKFEFILLPSHFVNVYATRDEDTFCCVLVFVNRLLTSSPFHYNPL